MRLPAVALILLAAATAAATDGAAASKARAWYDEGVVLFKAGRFVEAAERFQLAYNVDPAPTLLYNLARAHEEAGHAAEAQLFFESYLDRYPQAEDRAEVERRIAHLRAAPGGRLARGEGSAPTASATAGEAPLAAGADADRLTLSVWGAAGVSGTAAFQERAVRTGDERVEAPGVDEDLERSWAVGGSVEYAVAPALTLGGRLSYAVSRAEDSELTYGAIDVGPVVRGRLPLRGRFALHALGWGGFTSASSDDAEFPLGDLSFEGSGWHVGGGAGGSVAVHPDVRLSLTIGAVHQRVELESNRIAGSRYEFGDTRFTRIYVEAGALVDL